MNQCLFQYTNPRELDRWKIEHLEKKRALLTTTKEKD